MLTRYGIGRADLLARAGRLASLDADRPPARFVGEIDLAPDEQAAVAGRPLREAAVLLPLVERADGLSLILTRRTDHLRSHSGQVALPGGKIDAADAGSPLRAALREAHEEIGLRPDVVEPVGRLSPFVSTSGFRIHPVIGLVDHEPELAANPDEVAELFDVPFAFLMDPANHRVEWRDFAGRRRYFYVMTYGERRIWGVTAGILRLCYDEVFR